MELNWKESISQGLLFIKIVPMEVLNFQPLISRQRRWETEGKWRNLCSAVILSFGECVYSKCMRVCVCVSG